MNGWADYGLWRAHREELMREAEERRLARAVAREGLEELPPGRWGRISALLGSLDGPFHRAFRG